MDLARAAGPVAGRAEEVLEVGRAGHLPAASVVDPLVVGPAARPNLAACPAVDPQAVAGGQAGGSGVPGSEGHLQAARRVAGRWVAGVSVDSQVSEAPAPVAPGML